MHSPRKWRRAMAVLAAALACLLATSLLVTGTTNAANAATVDTNAWYVLVNRNSGKALDVYNFATTDGARITQWTRNDGDQPAVAVRRLRRRLLPAQVAALRQGPRRLQLLHRRRRARSCSGPTATAPTSSSGSPTPPAATSG